MSCPSSAEKVTSAMARTVPSASSPTARMSRPMPVLPEPPSRLFSDFRLPFCFPMDPRRYRGCRGAYGPGADDIVGGRRVNFSAGIGGLRGSVHRGYLGWPPMDVRCERCRAEYVVDDARIPEAGVKVGCTQCGHGFLLRKRVLAVAVPLKGGDGDDPAPRLRPRARLRRCAQHGGGRRPGRMAAPAGIGRGLPVPRDLHPAALDRRAEGLAGRRGGLRPGRGDLAPPGRHPRAAELLRRGREGRPGGRAEAGPGGRPRPAPRPGWRTPPGRATLASLPAGPPARSRRLPRPRRRVVWVALLALALLGVAAGTVYLRRGAEAAAGRRPRGRAGRRPQAGPAARGGAAPEAGGPGRRPGCTRARP